MNDKTKTEGRKPDRFTSRDLQRAQRVGEDIGLRKGRQEILDWLEAAYLSDPGRPDRGTPKAEAILEMARDAANHFNEELKKGRRK